jgi:hypothetical protein
MKKQSLSLPLSAPPPGGGRLAACWLGWPHTPLCFVDNLDTAAHARVLVGCLKLLQGAPISSPPHDLNMNSPCAQLLRCGCLTSRDVPHPQCVCSFRSETPENMGSSLSKLAGIIRGGTAAKGDEGASSLAPLVGLVERLRVEMTELQGRGEGLDEELEAVRERLGIAEATLERMPPPQEEAAAEEDEDDAEEEEEEERPAEGGGLEAWLGAALRKDVSRTVQASVGYQMSPSEARSSLRSATVVLDRLLLPS